ncbi:MAG: hypothetical protein ACYC5N_10055, partial [Endomicrobiales bacterium]
IDVVQRQSEPITAHFGTELGYVKEEKSTFFGVDGLYLRLGLDGFALEDRYGYRNYINNNINYTLGAGIELSYLGRGLQLDYALGSYRLGDNSRISISMYF